MVIYGKDSRMPGLFRPKKELEELMDKVADEYLIRKEAEKYCKAITKKTAFPELYKGCYDRIVCTENSCEHSSEKRLIEKKFEGEKTGYICPSPNGLIEEVTARKPKNNKTLLWIE